MSGTPESVYQLTDSERAWLKELNGELWPDMHVKKGNRIKLEAIRPLKTLEFDRICELIETRSLVTRMFSSSMFGGYGMDIFEHEPFPDTGPIFLLRLVEDHHPDPHPLEIVDGYAKHVQKAGGVGRDDAWESFSRFTHSEKNREWLKGYKMEPPKERGHYDY